MSRETLTQILDLARWAPSGDNTQPWRFEIIDDHRLRVHGFDTRDHVLYDFDGHPSHIAHGALLETIRIAASGFGLSAQWTITSSGEDRTPVYDVRFTPDSSPVRDPLFDCIETRMVQRRPMKITPLTDAQRVALVDAAGPGFRVQFFESTADRMNVAKLLWDSAKIRLTCPEAYPVHKEIIEWRARYSKVRIPEQAVGMDPVTARLMEWVMQSWERVDFFNRYLFGTVVPRIQLDLVPAIFCAAHLLVRPVRSPELLQDWLDLGVTVQRLWLTATSQGLHLQPQMTPIIFRWYAQSGRRFSSKPDLLTEAVQLSNKFERLAFANSVESFSFFARIGTSRTPQSRSTREHLCKKMKTST